MPETECGDFVKEVRDIANQGVSMNIFVSQAQTVSKSGPVFVLYGKEPCAEVRSNLLRIGFDRYVQLPLTSETIYNLLKYCDLTK